MPAALSSLSDRAGELAPTAFHAQLRRLESLQTLMTQGGAVVSEVAQFLVKAREELSSFQQEQERYATAQEQLIDEKRLLSERVEEAQRQADASALRVAEQETLIAALRNECSVAKRAVPVEQLEALQAERTSLEEQLSSARAQIARLETSLQQERASRENTVGKAREEEASQYGAEIGLLKDRLTALERQLEAERQRRTRLMEVVKTHDVTVNNRVREPA